MNPSSPALCPILSQDPDVLMKSVTIYDHIDASVRVGIPSWVARGIFTLLTRDPCGFPGGSRVITVVNILKLAHMGFGGYCLNSLGALCPFDVQSNKSRLILKLYATGGSGGSDKYKLKF